MSWISDQGFRRSIQFLIQEEDLSGRVNISTVEPSTDQEFMSILRQRMRIPFGIRKPCWLLELKVILINTESRLILKSRNVIPQRLSREKISISTSQSGSITSLPISRPIKPAYSSQIKEIFRLFASQLQIRNVKPIIISGSSRNDGNTTQVVKLLVKNTNWDSLDLNDYQFSYYDYKHENRDDDFLPLMRHVIKKYDTLILATPVYWYSMSGIMKVFFDRISDLLTIEKDLGRKLRTKKMACISASGGNDLGDLFWLPFRESAQYLGMQYLGDLHVKVNEEHNQLAKGMEENIIYFIARLNRSNAAV